MSGLDELLEAARKADPGSRILLRDGIAVYGDQALNPMATWLNDPRLGAFGVRVLQRIAADPAQREAVLAVLSRVDRGRLSPDVAGDVTQALKVLRSSALPMGAKRARARAMSWDRAPEPGEASTIEERFHDAMLDIYWLAGRATGYWASYFLRGVRNKGGVTEARDLLRKAGTSPGFERLKAERRLDLSMESLVLRPEFASLFTLREVQIAHQRLVDAAYQPDDS